MFLETADIETATAGYATRFSGVAGQYFLDKQAQVALSLLSDFSGAKVLDVGGGHAQLAEPLIKNGFDVTVTGSADSCREHLSERIPENNFHYKTCDSLHLPFADQSFDVVMSFRLLSHVDRWTEFIAELTRVAKYSVLFDYADRRSTNILYDRFFHIKKRMEGNTRHFNLFTRPLLSNELKKNGFQKPIFKPQFFCPMVFHRKLNNRLISSAVESCFRISGVTRLFGSPIILRSDRIK